MDSNLLQPVCMPPESCREWTGLTPASPAGRVDTPACPINLSRGRRRIASKNILCACLLKAGFTPPGTGLYASWNWVRTSRSWVLLFFNWVVRVGSGAADDGARLSTRARLLLELVVDIKNNKGKAGAAR
jgi:hypothetical protein